MYTSASVSQYTDNRSLKKKDKTYGCWWNNAGRYVIHCSMMQAGFFLGFSSRCGVNRLSNRRCL